MPGESSKAKERLSNEEPDKKVWKSWESESFSNDPLKLREMIVVISEDRNQMHRVLESGKWGFGQGKQECESGLENKLKWHSNEIKFECSAWLLWPESSWLTESLNYTFIASDWLTARESRLLDGR